jgi:nucleotide-binding universal stress UspA family protein
MYRRIVAALKHDSNDEVVVMHAVSLARLTGALVSVMHAVHAHSREESVYMEEQARDYLQGWVERISAQQVDADLYVVQGEPAEAINTFAESVGADLIIMATHGHSELRHVFAGSVTEEVLRSGDIPVLLVRTPREQRSS